jgi:hypothetical protein
MEKYSFLLEANLLPEPYSISVTREYKFGEEGNLIVELRDDAFFTPKAFDLNGLRPK